MNKLKNILQVNKNFKDLLKASSYSFIARIIAAGLNLTTILIIARYYGADILGLMNLLNTVLSISIMFSLMGLNVLILRIVPEKIERYSLQVVKFIYIKFSRLVTLSSLVIMIILFFSANMISSIFFHNSNLSEFLIYALPLIFLNSISSLKLEVLRALQNIKLYSFLQLISPSLYLILLLISMYLVYDKYDPIYLIYIVSFISFIIIGLIINKQLGTYNKDKIDSLKSKELLILSFPMLFTSFMHLIIGQTDILMISYYMDINAVGVYSIALKLSMLINFILVSINTLAAPKFAELYFSKNLQDLNLLAQNSSKLMFYASLPLIIIYIFLGSYIINIFGTEFQGAYIVLMFLIFGQFVNIIAGSVGVFLDMTGNQKIFQKIIFASAILNIILNFLFIPKYGLNGAAFSSMISIILWNVLATIIIKKRYGYFIGYMPFKMKK